MSLRFPYQLAAVGHAVLPLGGRWVRPRPLVPITVMGPRDSRLRMALVDTAADDTVFPEVLAGLIGVDLTSAPAGTAGGVGGLTFAVRYAQVTLRLTDGREFREWPAWVGFTAARLVHPLLGFAGCLQFFSVLALGDREEVELIANRLYPGT